MVDAVRDAWHRANVVQCGYCQPGQTLAAVSLLESDASPDDPKIDAWMSGNLCRCGTYPRIRAAIHDAADTLAAGRDPDPLVAPPDPEVHRLTPDEMADPVHPYIRIRDDGTIVAYSSQIEMGQGIHTGLATIVAEELDADFDSVRVVNAANGGGPPRDVYGNPDTGGALQITGASNSTKGYWARYRLVAAQARARLAAAAAELWDVPADEVEFERGVVRHASGKEATFAQLAARAEQLPVPDGVQPKDPRDYRLIGGEGRLRVDAVPKILGTARFTIDVSVPGMLTAVVLHPPRFGSRVASRGRSRRRWPSPGSPRWSRSTRASPWSARRVADAQRGLRALAVEWDDAAPSGAAPPSCWPSTSGCWNRASRPWSPGTTATRRRCSNDAPTVVDGTYALPYLAHATMEPNNAACRMREDGVLEVWASTESPEYTRMSASEAAGIDKEQVEVHVTFAGGSFGLHSSSERDPTAEAVQIARALDWKHPIKVQSLREEDFKSGRYRAMAVHRVRAAADASGRLTALHHQIVAEPTSVNLPFVRDVMFTNGVDFFTTTGAADPPYALRELQARVDELRVRRPDDGVAIGRQLAHRVRARVGDRRARDRGRPRPRRPATRAARRQPAHAARARARRGAQRLGIPATGGARAWSHVLQLPQPQRQRDRDLAR